MLLVPILHHTTFHSGVLGKPSIKKTVKLGKNSQLIKPPILTWEPLTDIFIVYLGFRDHEMDFEINFFFPYKIGLALRKFSSSTLSCTI